MLSFMVTNMKKYTCSLLLAFADKGRIWYVGSTNHFMDSNTLWTQTGILQLVLHFFKYHSTRWLQSIQGRLFTFYQSTRYILLSGNDLQEMERPKAFLLKRFRMKGLGDLKYFLGIEFSHSKKGIFMSQRKYALDILQDSGLLGARPHTFPMEQNLTLTLTDGALLKDPSRYRRLVGKLINRTMTRPDIVYHVHQARTCDF